MVFNTSPVNNARAAQRTYEPSLYDSHNGLEQMKKAGQFTSPPTKNLKMQLDPYQTQSTYGAPFGETGKGYQSAFKSAASSIIDDKPYFRAESQSVKPQVAKTMTERVSGRPKAEVEASYQSPVKPAQPAKFDAKLYANKPVRKEKDDFDYLIEGAFMTQPSN